MSFRFTDDDCRREGTCNCGFCKRISVTAEKVIRDCDYGDCRQTADRHCPRFGYPACQRHAHANCIHASGAECTTQRQSR